MRFCAERIVAKTPKNSLPKRRKVNIQLSEIDPSSLLKGNTPRLIDEWQIAPKLWDATRYEVDTRREVGQFILTGSAVPVDSTEFHKGHGLALMKAIEEKFSTVNKYYLDTPEWNIRTNNFYKKCGYTATRKEHTPDFDLIIFEKVNENAIS